MKKIFMVGLFALLIMQACKKDQQDLIDGKRPEQRVAEDLEKYRNELVNSPNGWVAYLGTTLVGGGYNFYMSFDKENKVIMRADYDSDIALESIQSTYRIKQVMAPSLIFDTYNLLHLLQDPNPDFFNGDLAVGYGSDFEFEIREQVGDTIKLVGKKQKASLLLVKATADQKAFYTSDAFSESIDGITGYLKNNPFTYILDPKDNTKKIQVSISPDVRSRTFSLISLSGTEIVTNSGIFSFSIGGARLNNPIKNGDEIYVSISWDATANKLFLVSTKGTKTEILASALPIMPLHVVMGGTVSSINLDGQATLPGAGQTFVTAYTTLKTSVAAAFATPTIVRDLKVIFNSTKKTMIISINVVQNGTSVFPAIYTYNYTKTDAGEYKFTDLVTSGGGGSAILSRMRTFILNRVEAQTFLLDYYNDQANQRVLGKFSSKETPDFTLTGVLK